MLPQLRSSGKWYGRRTGRARFTEYSPPMAQEEEQTNQGRRYTSQSTQRKANQPTLQNGGGRIQVLWFHGIFVFDVNNNHDGPLSVWRKLTLAGYKHALLCIYRHQNRVLATFVAWRYLFIGPVLTLSGLGKLYSRRPLEIVFVFYTENRFWHRKLFVWNVKILFSMKNKRHIIYLSSAE